LAQIIQLDPSLRSYHVRNADVAESCPHKSVTVYTAYRVVCCSLCSAVLDPFDVLVDMVKRSVPPEPNNQKEQRLEREEEERRQRGTNRDSGPKE